MVDVPAGFKVLASGRSALAIVRESYLPWFLAASPLDPGALLAAPGSEEYPALAGRGRLGRVTAGETCLVVKRYRRGGALRGILPDLFSGPGRMLADLRASERALAHGVPTARAACVLLERRLGVLWTGYLFSEEIEGAVSLASFLGRAPAPYRNSQTHAASKTPPSHVIVAPPNTHPNDTQSQDRSVTPQIHVTAAPSNNRPGDQQSHAAAMAIGERAVETVRALHDAGVVHRDLNLGNLLVHDGAIFVIDLDGARIVESPGERLRFANLARLDRSYVKLFGGVAGGPLSHEDRLRLLGHYCGGDGAMLRAMKERLAAHKRSLRRHAYGRRNPPPHAAGSG